MQVAGWTLVAAGFTDENTFALSELLAPKQRRSIARVLHEELIGSRPEECATLLAGPDNPLAQAAYAA